MNQGTIRNIRTLLEEMNVSSPAASENLASLLRPGVAYLVSGWIPQNDVGPVTESILRFVVSSAHLGGATSALELIRTTLDAIHAVVGTQVEQPAGEVRVSAGVLTEIAALPPFPRMVLYRCYSAGQSHDQICSSMGISKEELQTILADGKAAIDRARKPFLPRGACDLVAGKAAWTSAKG